jgi:hypothetical protein
MIYGRGANLDWEAQLVLNRRLQPLVVFLPRFADLAPSSMPPESPPDPKTSQLPDLLRSRLAGLGAFDAHGETPPGILLLCKPDGSVISRRVAATWDELREGIKWLLESANLSARRNPDRRWSLVIGSSLLRWWRVVGVPLSAALTFVVGIALFSPTLRNLGEFFPGEALAVIIMILAWMLFLIF